MLHESCLIETEASDSLTQKILDDIKFLSAGECALQKNVHSMAGQIVQLVKGIKSLQDEKDKFRKEMEETASCVFATFTQNMCQFEERLDALETLVDDVKKT